MNDITVSTMHSNLPCTHTYDHISQQLYSLADSTQQHTLYANEPLIQPHHVHLT